MDDDTTGSYMRFMQNDCSELHNHVCEALLIANHWAINCQIVKEDFTFQEIDSSGIVVKSYGYQEIWDIIPKKKVIYVSESSGITRRNIETYLEPITDEYGNLICKTNSGNIQSMFHMELFNDFFENTKMSFAFETPVYVLEKVDGKRGGALNKYYG